MPDIYIGNPTPQRHQIQYYVGEKKGNPIPAFIAARHQIKITFNSDVETKQLIESYTPYGLRDIKEVDRFEEYTFLVYSLTGPIPGQKLTYAAEHNHSKLEEQGKVNRAILAQSAANSYDNALKEVGINTTSFALDMKEIPTGGSDDTFRETIELEQEGVESEAPRRGRGRPRKN